MRTLSPRTKKFIGTLVFVVWLPLYALAAMRIGVSLVSVDNPFTMLLYYVVAGTIWIVPVGLALPWMNRERSKSP